MPAATRRRALALLGLLGVAAALAALAPARWTPPAFATVRATQVPSEAVLLDRHGRLLHERRVDPTRRRAAWVPLDAISPAFIDTVVAIEDRRFQRHRGVDWHALAGIAWRALVRGERRGGSTLSMQVAGLIDPRSGQGGRRSLARKWRQVRAARALEAHWSKREILEAYVNLVGFRGELVGLGAASRALAGRRPDGLDRVDSLLLTSLLAAPNAPPAAVARRACALAAALDAPPDCRALTRRALAMLARAPDLAPRLALAPHPARQLLARPGEVRSTLDREMQRAAHVALVARLAELADRHVRDGAVLAVDNESGEVLVYVGNQGAGSSAHHVDGVRARRSAGSTLKPFLYGLALERRQLTAASLLDDSPLNLETPAGLYVPRNYDDIFRGLTPLRDALAGSLNLPAVRTLHLVGADRFVARLRALGFGAVVHDAEYYGYSLALGGVEVSLWELVEAYRWLARGERGFVPAHYLADGVRPVVPAGPPDTVDARAAAFIVGDILADRGSRSMTFGLDSPLALPFRAAVKTGTSKHMRDNWCIGYSSRYTVGVWVGNFDGSPMWEVSGMSGAAPVWAEVMRALHAEPPQPPQPPPGVERALVARAVSAAPAPEWFLAGTAPPAAAQARAELPPRIAYPGRDSVLVLDPDIPSAQQRVFFRARSSRTDLSWELNGHTVPNGAAAGWAPRPGAHELALVDGARVILDRVRFSVRGNPRGGGLE